MKPRCELSLIVAVKRGPGIIAPDSAMIKDVLKMESSVESTVRPYRSTAGRVSKLFFSTASAGMRPVMVSLLYGM